MQTRVYAASRVLMRHLVGIAVLDVAEPVKNSSSHAVHTPRDIPMNTRPSRASVRPFNSSSMPERKGAVWGGTRHSVRAAA